MNIVYAFGLATAIASSQSLHAQSCSGGADGGMDATGNQCNTHHTVLALATTPAGIPPVEPSGTNSFRVRPLASRLSKYSLPQFRLAILATPARRSATAVIAPPTTALSDDTSRATCSGGGDGGMDPTGNQCNE